MKPHLLAIDVGNTSIACGCFAAERLAAEWRLPTRRSASAGEIADGLQRGLDAAGVPAHTIAGVIVASVVPPLDPPIAKAVEHVTGRQPLFIDHTNAGVPIAYPHPEEIGADRLADAAGALAKYGAPCLVVDFGTATTFDYIDAGGKYCGGPIAPGVALINDALATAAAKLRPIPLAAVDQLIPTSTAEAVQAGVYHGYVGLTHALLTKLIAAVGGTPKVIATGGYAQLIAPACPSIQTIDPHLTLEGLRTIWARNA